MAKRRKPTDPPPEEVHREMLEYLSENPPPRPKKRPAPKPKPKPAPRPSLMLRKLRLVTALHRLETFVTQQRLKGTPEVLVVVGRGHRSGEGGPVISPAVQEWCDGHPALIRRWDFAPADEGGGGALVLWLVPAK
jgi:dsDNA-specific endonuclease/ATPase MutS2